MLKAYDYECTGGCEAVTEAFVETSAVVVAPVCCGVPMNRKLTFARVMLPLGRKIERRRGHLPEHRRDTSGFVKY